VQHFGVDAKVPITNIFGQFEFRIIAELKSKRFPIQFIKKNLLGAIEA
jgi:hypothetical protein